MKFFRVLLLCGFVLLFALAAAADGIPDIRIIFDPTPPNPAVQLTDILNAGTSVAPPWQSCSDAGIPDTGPFPLSNETACLALANLTGGPITALTIEFSAPAAIAGQIVDCENNDNFLANNNCPTGTLTAGELVDITLSGGTPVPNDTDIFFGANAAGLNSPADFPPVTITDPTPEPATLLLIPTGLLLLGLEWGRRRRRAMSA
ncbi:MAG: PEP-CTERM sorting domain-containing protein [Terriglobia bacterium]